MSRWKYDKYYILDAIVPPGLRLVDVMKYTDNNSALLINILDINSPVMVIVKTTLMTVLMQI